MRTVIEKVGHYKSQEAEINKLKYLLTGSVKCNKRLRQKMQRALSVVNGIVDIIFESTNCYDCMELRDSGKHKKGCRAKEAILFLSDNAKEKEIAELNGWDKK